MFASLSIARDSAGNVVRVHGEEPHPRGFTNETTQVTYDVADQILVRNGAAYQYDADGNLEQVSGAASWMAGYDLENRLVSVSRTGQPSLSFAYDAFGRRARRVVGGAIEEFQRGDDGALLSETDDAGAIAAEYIYADGRLLAMRRGGQTYFYLFDQLGSTLALTDGAGAMVASYGYDATGRVIASTGSLVNRFTFVGEHGVEDDGAGLYLMQRRHYDAASRSVRAAGPDWDRRRHEPVPVRGRQPRRVRRWPRDLCYEARVLRVAFAREPEALPGLPAGPRRREPGSFVAGRSGRPRRWWIGPRWRRRTRF